MSVVPNFRGLAVLAVVWAAAALTSGGAQPKLKPNVILITLDTVRADHLGCYGDRRASTPTLDALAGEGIRFEHAYTAVPLTLPSHAAILTGMYPFANGVRSQPGFRLGSGPPTLAEIFAQAGYRTAAVIGSSIIERRFGLNRGFQDYDDHIANIEFEEYAGLPATKRDASDVVARGLRWLSQRASQGGANQPFFLWLHFYDAHLPYAIAAAERGKYRATYDGEIAYIDAMLKRFFVQLREANLFDSSIIAVVADHGEGLGDHGESSHGFFIYDSTIRVPLIIKPPAAIPVAARHQSAEIVSTVDIAPTLLRLAGLQVPPAMQGSARMAAISGGGTDRDSPVYAESMFPLLSMGWNPLRALISGSTKFIQAPRSELYDLGGDPGELHNRISSEQALANTFPTQLDQFVRARTPATPSDSRMPVDQQTAQLFSSLGYVGSPVLGGAPKFTTDRPDPKDRVHEEEAILKALQAYEVHQYATSLRLLHGILATDPGEPLALDCLGTIQFKRHELSAARKTYSDLLRVAPYYTTAYAELAHVDTMLGERKQAAQLYQRAFELDPSNGRVVRELGILSLEDGQVDSARQQLQRSLELQPGDVYALNALAQIDAQQGRFEAAANELKQAVTADPKLVPPRLNLGFVYLRLGRYNDTEALMEDTIARNPREPQAYAELGAARLQLGDRQRAAEAFDRALALDSNNQMAKQGMAILAQHQ